MVKFEVEHDVQKVLDSAFYYNCFRKMVRAGFRFHPNDCFGMYNTFDYEILDGELIEYPSKSAGVRRNRELYEANMILNSRFHYLVDGGDFHDNWKSREARIIIEDFLIEKIYKHVDKRL